MIDEKEISYSTFMGYRNIVYNYTLPVLGNKKMTVLLKKNIPVYIHFNRFQQCFMCAKKKIWEDSMEEA